MWRVTEEPHPHVSGYYVYAIMRKRNLITRVDGWTARAAIETAINIALQARVLINWEAYK